MATLKYLTSRLRNVKSAIRKMKCDVCIADSSILEVDKSLTHLNEIVEKLRRKVKDKDKQMQYLYAKYVYLHSYSRREKFFGTLESEGSASQGKDAVGSTDALRDFLHDAVGFEDVKGNMEFQRMHRI